MYALDPISIYIGASIVALVVAGVWALHHWRVSNEVRRKVYGRNS
jgi:hypothetical protein